MAAIRETVEISRRPEEVFAWFRGAGFSGLVQTDEIGVRGTKARSASER